MGMKIVTGRTGTAHVTSADDGARNAGIIGTGKYIFDIGNKFAYEIISNNLIRVKDGYGINQGRQFGIEHADYEECEIDNGLQGVKRTDLIVAKYKRDSLTGLESVTIAVIKGTSGDNYTDPEYVEGNILNGDDEDDFLLYRVCLNGISIEKVERMFSISTTLDSLYKANNTGKVDLVWSNDGTNFNSVDSYAGGQTIGVPENYDSFIILSTGGTLTHILNILDVETNIISVLNVDQPAYGLFWARRKVSVIYDPTPSGASHYYNNALFFDACYYRPYVAGGEFTLANACCVPFRIYGIRK